MGVERSEVRNMLEIMVLRPNWTSRMSVPGRDSRVNPAVGCLESVTACEWRRYSSVKELGE